MSRPIIVVSDITDDHHDSRALDRWAEESLALQQAGVYKQLAALIRIQRNQLFLNIGAGLTLMEHELVSRKPGAHFVASEINHATIDEARLNLHHAGIPSRIIRDRDGEN